MCCSDAATSASRLTDDRELKALCLQNPEFWLHPARIIVRRYEENLGEASVG
jgi:hypothetical protein